MVLAGCGSGEPGRDDAIRPPGGQRPEVSDQWPAVSDQMSGKVLPRESSESVGTAELRQRLRGEPIDGAASQDHGGEPWQLARKEGLPGPSSVDLGGGRGELRIPGEDSARAALPTEDSTSAVQSPASTDVLAESRGLPATASEDATTPEVSSKPEVRQGPLAGVTGSARQQEKNTLAVSPDGLPRSAGLGSSDSRGLQPDRSKADENRPASKPADTEPVPLVAAPDRLQRLHPSYPAWVDPVTRELVLIAQVCQNQVPLELFACVRGSKEHESILSVGCPAYVVHAGLLALGAREGSPVQFAPEFRPPSGSEIAVEVRWIDEQGNRRSAAGQDWIQDLSLMFRLFDGVSANSWDDELDPKDGWEAWQPMRLPWVFAGSAFVRDERTGRQVYLADQEGELICVSNFPAAVLDVPIESTAANAALLFRCYEERIPPIGTTVTLVLKPKPEAAR